MPSDDNGIYGNNVTHRSNSPLSDGALKSFIDVVNPLPGGLLFRFYFYANPSNRSGFARLQIWRYAGDSSRSNFRLVWQQRVEINATSTSNTLLYSVSTTSSDADCVVCHTSMLSAGKLRHIIHKAFSRLYAHNSYRNAAGTVVEKRKEKRSTGG